jgi:nucleotide-binding universal stress UspA family protein
MTILDLETRAPLRRLLLPTDFSKNAERALRRALLLPMGDATIHVIHVLPPVLPAKLRANITTDAKVNLESMLSRAREEVKERNIDFTSSVVSGEPYVEIIRCARSINAELIVMGRHGRRPFQDMFIGTTAERVIRKGDVPVLAVNLEPTGPFRKPLIATDLDDSAPNVFNFALRILGPSVRRVHVVHALEIPFEGFISPTFTKTEMKEYRSSFRQKADVKLTALLARYEASDIGWKTTFRIADARSLIIKEAVRLHADLIALGTHGRSGMAHALVGSVAEWIISHAPCDVLVSRPIRFSFELP